LRTVRGRVRKAVDLVAGHDRAGVLDNEVGVSVRDAGRDGDPAVVGVVADGVVDQVVCQAFQQDWVAEDACGGSG
jgi:hypothetical protein